MNWFIVVYFLVSGSWIEADQLGKEGWSPITQPNYKVCIQKINESNERFKKIADYRENSIKDIIYGKGKYIDKKVELLKVVLSETSTSFAEWNSEDN